LLAVLAGSELSAGRLYTEVTSAPGVRLERREFERLLSELQRQGWVELWLDSFEKDGKVIEYRKVKLTEKGTRASAADIDGLKLADVATASSKKKKRSAYVPKAVDGASLRQGGSGEASPPPDEEALRGSKLFGILREWRKGEARSKGVPAFRILGDR